MNDKKIPITLTARDHDIVRSRVEAKLLRASFSDDEWEALCWFERWCIANSKSDRRESEGETPAALVPAFERWLALTADKRHLVEQLVHADVSAPALDKIPSDPPAAYASDWKGWNDFLGVDPNTPEGRENIEQDKRDEARLSGSSGSANNSDQK
jgi:hypothetical protein